MIGSILNGFVFIREIGSGTYSKVYLVKEKTTARNFAIKKILVGESKVECQVLEKLRYHPNVIYFHESFVEQETRYLVFEYCYCNLSDYILKFTISNDMITTFFQQLLSALVYIHSQGISHRDLKPENCLLTWNYTFPVIKLADFGLCTTTHRTNAYGCGSKRYMAYECYNRPNNRDEYYDACPTDIWASGIILLNLITRKCPWERPSFDDAFFRYHMYEHEIDSFVRVFKVSFEVAKLLRKTFSLNPTVRPRAHELSIMVYKLENKYRHEQTLFE